MTDVIWEDPPTRYTAERREAGANGMYADLLPILQENPGRWCRLIELDDSKAARNVASAINGRRTYFALWGCRAVSRKVDDKYRVYIQWPA